MNYQMPQMMPPFQMGSGLKKKKKKNDDDANDSDDDFEDPFFPFQMAYQMMGQPMMPHQMMGQPMMPHQMMGQPMMPHQMMPTQYPPHFGCNNGLYQHPSFSCHQNSRENYEEKKDFVSPCQKEPCEVKQLVDDPFAPPNDINVKYEEDDCDISEEACDSPPPEHMHHNCDSKQSSNCSNSNSQTYYSHPIQRKVYHKKSFNYFSTSEASSDSCRDNDSILDTSSCLETNSEMSDNNFSSNKEIVGNTQFYHEDRNKTNETQKFILRLPKKKGGKAHIISKIV